MRPQPRRIGNWLLGALPSDAYRLLEADLTQVELCVGFTCASPDQLIEQVYFPITGMISLSVGKGDGHWMEASSIGREGAVGLQSAFGESVSFPRATVKIPGKFCVIPASRLERAAGRSAAIKQTVFRYMEGAWADTQQIAACNSNHDGLARLSRWLLQCADHIDCEQLLLRQEHLAGALGLQRTTVTLLAQDLQNRAMIRYSRGKIVIADRRALEASACRCYAAMRKRARQRRSQG